MEDINDLKNQIIILRAPLREKEEKIRIVGAIEKGKTNCEFENMHRCEILPSHPSTISPLKKDWWKVECGEKRKNIEKGNLTFSVWRGSMS